MEALFDLILQWSILRDYTVLHFHSQAPSSIAWHPNDGLVLVANSKGDIQASFVVAVAFDLCCHTIRLYIKLAGSIGTVG